jgi:hypothetical protein
MVGISIETSEIGLQRRFTCGSIGMFWPCSFYCTKVVKIIYEKK